MQSTTALLSKKRDSLFRIFPLLVLWTLVVIVSLGGFSVFAWALPAPAQMTLSSSSFLGQGLGRACFAFDLPADVLSCNAAFIAKEKNRRFQAQLGFGNNVSYFDEASNLAKGKADQESIHSLFSRHHNNDLYAKAELGYVQETFAWSLTPLQVHYLSSFRNQALPEVDVYASVEESVRFQFGSYLSEDWSWGAQVRYVHRRFVAQRFFLTELLVTDGDQILKPQEQHIVYLEPALLYAPQGNDWNPETTLSLQNFGYSQKKFREIPSHPELHLTASVTPELIYGRWGVGLDLFWSEEVKKALDPLSLGTFYEFGILRLIAGLSRSQQSLGFSVFDTWWNAGIMQSWRQEDPDSPSLDEKKTYLFVGIEI